jgi:uncharacterized protein YndB with AHSA1/START domain
MLPDSTTASLLVQLAPAEAWRRFVVDFAIWWPREHCFCGPDNLARVWLDDHAGGTWGEVTKAGTHTSWGSVLHMEPPRHLELGWQMDARPVPWIPEPDHLRASRVDIRFEPEGDGTRITVTHKDFSAHGAGQKAMTDVMVGLKRWEEWLGDFARAQKLG